MVLPSKASYNSDSVSDEEGEDLSVNSGRDAGHVPLPTIRSNIEDLEEAYKHDTFAIVRISFICVHSSNSADKEAKDVGDD